MTTHDAATTAYDTPSGGTPRVRSLTDLLTDPRFDRASSLLRLQGWRDDDLEAATNTSPLAHRLAPAACGTLALAIAATGSTVLLVLTLATALAGATARNHPFETAYNMIVSRKGGQSMPANRAAKRLGCAIGSVFLVGAGLAAAAGHTMIAATLLVSLGSLALFVAATGICVPSILFAVMFGIEPGTAPRLISRPAVTTVR
jgi:hypothetical protein